METAAQYGRAEFTAMRVLDSCPDCPFRRKQRLAIATLRGLLAQLENSMNLDICPYERPVDADALQRGGGAMR